jgi:hypothetical protein
VSSTNLRQSDLRSAAHRKARAGVVKHSGHVRRGLYVAKCLVCAKCELALVGPQTTRSLRCSCPRCGEFCVTSEVTGSLKDLDDDKRLRVSRWIREQNRMGSEVIIRTKDIDYLRNLPKIEYRKKEEIVLEFVPDKTKRLRSVGDIFWKS